jgi:hypothetical protein
MVKQSGGNFKGRRHQRGKKKQMGGFIGGLLGGGGGKGSTTNTSNTGSNVNITNDQGRRNYNHRRQIKTYYGDSYGDDYDFTPPYKYTQSGQKKIKIKRKKKNKQTGGFLGKLLGFGGGGGSKSTTRNSGSNVYINNDRGRRNNYYDDDEDYYYQKPKKRRRRRCQKGKIKFIVFYKFFKYCI